MLGPLVLERPEEPFHDGVVVAAAGAAHRALDAQSPQGLLIGVAGVLAAAIAVVQQFAGRPVVATRSPAASAALTSRRRQRVAERPADDLAAEQVEHDGQVDPARERRQIGDVGHPLAIGRCRP